MPTIFAIIVGALLNEFVRSAYIAWNKPKRRPIMHYFIIERLHEQSGFYEPSYHRPFKAKSADAANAEFEMIVPQSLWDTHRFRRVEYGEYLNQGGVP